jgi:hypothetical protein
VSQIPAIPPLSALPYHRAAVQFLKTREPELWAWASSAPVRGAAIEAMRTEMLKSNYRLDAEGHPELVERCALVTQRLGIVAPVTLYQSTAGHGMNACLCYCPREIHIVFTGPILATLKDAELDAVLAHELAHYYLWELDGGDYLIADRLLMAAANDPRAAASHVQTARRFQLYTEIFADRGSFAGCGQLDAAVAALVKVETGLSQVSAASYLRQADEIFSRGEVRAQGVDHPETFIRARALRLWRDKEPELEAWLTDAIEGPLSVDSLDLVSQGRMARITCRLLGQFLRPKWFQTEPVLAHAKAFFSDFSPSSVPDELLISDLAGIDGPTREYLGYLLLDFATVDRELEDVPLASALDWAARLGLTEEFERFLVKDLKLGKRQLAKLKKEAPALLQKAETT